jgi:hypothetical protein
MDFLALCKRLRQEAGISGTGPSAVTNQTGEMGRVVGWIGAAWSEIQMLHQNWMWMRGSFSFNTTLNDYDYTPANAGISERFRQWDTETLRIYKTSEGVGNEFDLPYIPYNQYLRLYLTGTQTANRPICFTIGPDMKLLLGPKPNGIYTVSGEYWKSEQELAADDDEPELPSEFHMMIVWWALEHYGLFESAGEVIIRAKKKIKFFKPRLEKNQLPMMEQADTLCE